MLETAWESRWLPDQKNKPEKACFGGIAQLGEHLPCKQGVKGSNPFISTEWETIGMEGTTHPEECNAFFERQAERVVLYLENRITNRSESIKVCKNEITRHPKKKTNQERPRVVPR